MKNIAVFVLSPRSKNPNKCFYKSSNGFNEECVQTNETGLKYINWTLARENAKLDKVYAFVTDTAAEYLDEFKNIFREQKIVDVTLEDEGSLKGAFKSVSCMFDRIRTDLMHIPAEEISFYVDITGGPRHASVLMLVLIRMLKYYGYRTAMVIYTNLGAKEVEDATELMDMFDLLNGTQDFASFGNVDQIELYFKNKSKSNSLQNLLNRMESVAENFKICAGFKDMQLELESLNLDLKNYEQEICSDDSKIDDKEVFFSKLLPMINKEYGSILPRNGVSCGAPDMISWCLERGFLQQALTLYTEWLPAYLFDTKIIEVLDQNIIDECKKDMYAKKLNYKDWRSHLLTGYTPSTPKDKEINKDRPLSNTFDVNDLTKAWHNAKTFNDFLNVFKDNTVVLPFLQEIEKLKDVTNADQYLEIIAGDSSIVYCPKIIEKNLSVQHDNVEKWLTTRFKKENKFEDIIIKGVKMICKDSLIDIFFPSTAMTTSKSFFNRYDRGSVFNYLLKKNKIKTPIGNNRLIKLVRNFYKIQQVWRNSTNHAAAKAIGKTGNKHIIDSIKGDLMLLR